jgi:ferrous iron transport protein A
MNLNELPLGQSATVHQLAGPPAVRRRLMEMGITPNTSVHAVRRAPLGDPLDIKVRGYHLSLRRDEAAAVLLAPLPSTTPSPAST